MHSERHGEYNFFFNGDYSGEITVLDDYGVKTSKTFSDLVTTAQFDVIGEPYVQAVRDFVSGAAINEAISRLEQMTTDEALANPWLNNLLESMK